MLAVDNHTLRRRQLLQGASAVSLFVFGILLLEVLKPGALQTDNVVARILNTYASPWLDVAMSTVTHLGEPVYVVGVAIVLIGWLGYKKRYKQAVFVLAAIGVVPLLSMAIKIIVARHRPDLWTSIVQETGYSFPSLHAAMSAMLAMVVSALYWKTQWRAGVLVAAGVYALAVGVSRVYLGVHFPSDVVAGWAVSLLSITTTGFAVDVYYDRCVAWICRRFNAE